MCIEICVLRKLKLNKSLSHSRNVSQFISHRHRAGCTVRRGGSTDLAIISVRDHSNKFGQKIKNLTRTSDYVTNHKIIISRNIIYISTVRFASKRAQITLSWEWSINWQKVFEEPRLVQNVTSGLRELSTTF